MPLIKLRSNVSIADDKTAQLMSELSQLLGVCRTSNIIATIYNPIYLSNVVLK